MGDRNRSQREPGSLGTLCPHYAEHCTATCFLDWPGNPWTQAGYSFPAPGQVTAVGPTLHSGLGRLHFGGEHACYKLWVTWKGRRVRASRWPDGSWRVRARLLQRGEAFRPGLPCQPGAKHERNAAQTQKFANPGVARGGRQGRQWRGHEAGRRWFRARPASARSGRLPLVDAAYAILARALRLIGKISFLSRLRLLYQRAIYTPTSECRLRGDQFRSPRCAKCYRPALQSLA